jgi:hypothetical protein
MATKRAVSKPRVKKPIQKDDPKALTDKIIDLIKWVDNPFKLITVILLGTLAFGGYFAWDSRQVILNAITQNSHVPKLKKIDDLQPIAERLQKDLEAATVVVYYAALVVNSRTTLLALGQSGRDKVLDGANSSLFGNDPDRNAAMISMLNGEVQCGKLVVNGKSTEWESKQSVKFVCRGSVPPEMGSFEGYMTVGFKDEPQDLTAVKTRINLAAADMAK